jgi:hypothetical protein
LSAKSGTNTIIKGFADLVRSRCSRSATPAHVDYRIIEESVKEKFLYNDFEI